MRHGLVHLVVLELDVLVERTLGTVRLLAGIHRAAVVSLDLTGSSAEALLAIVFVAASVLNFLSLFLRVRPGLLRVWTCAS